jgi:hypothetical protein
LTKLDNQLEDFQKWRKRFDQTVMQAPAQTSGAIRSKTGVNEWNLEFGLPKKAQISRIVQLAPAQTP